MNDGYFKIRPVFIFASYANERKSFKKSRWTEGKLSYDFGSGSLKPLVTVKIIQLYNMLLMLLEFYRPSLSLEFYL